MGVGMDYQFTAQRNETSLGLYFYNARWLRSVPVTKWRGYDPSLGRFAQADTIVPGGVQGLDRYAYVNNNPIRSTDPTGHLCEDEDLDGHCPGYTPASTSTTTTTTTICVDGGWCYPQYTTWNLLRLGSPCTACHVTHWTGTIPKNDEISLTQVQGWRSFDKFALPVHAGGLGAIVALQAEAIAAAEESEGIQLYRGLSGDHPQLKTYLETGEVVPRGGSASVYEHVMGNTQSNYTSWSTNIEVAKEFAGPNGTILTVNTADIPNTIIPTYEWSPFDEFEILIEGIIKGAKPIP